jgi:peptidoglycan hydrolase-like protein with peptidoglycan-binding domain
MDSKLLTENGWKALAAKFKIKDNGLQKALAAYEKLEQEDHDALLKAIASVSQLATSLKKAKEIVAAPAAGKYLTDIVSATEAQKNDVTKAKAAAAKTAASAQKQAEAADKQKDETAQAGEASSDYSAALLAAFQKLKGAKDAVYEFVVCDAKTLGVMVAKKITAQHKTDLSNLTGSKKFLPMGTCSFQDGKFAFNLEKPIAGLARRLQESIKNYTGKKLPLVAGSETAEADEGQPPGAAAPAASPAAPPATAGPFRISASVGQGGKNTPADVTAVQNALNAKAKAGLQVDGKCGPKTIAAISNFQKTLGMPKPDGRIDPGRGTARALASSGPLPPAPAPPQLVVPPKLGKPELAKAPAVWQNMRKIVDTNIEQVKKAVRGHYAHEHPNLLKEIDQNLQKLDGITDKLDQRVAESLAKANAAKDTAARNAELKNAKGILAGYISYVKSEPLIAHVDANPWVKIDLKKTLADTITHMAQSIGS